MNVARVTRGIYYVITLMITSWPLKWYYDDFRIGFKVCLF